MRSIHLTCERHSMWCMDVLSHGHTHTHNDYLSLNRCPLHPLAPYVSPLDHSPYPSPSWMSPSWNHPLGHSMLASSLSALQTARNTQKHSLGTEHTALSILLLSKVFWMSGSKKSRWLDWCKKLLLLSTYLGCFANSAIHHNRWWNISYAKGQNMSPWTMDKKSTHPS